jgi:glycosyltransferase involved in cell wall biosynthesis
VPEASVIIATRDRAAALRTCLAALAGQTARGRFEILVVDNGSHDDTPAVIAEAASFGVRGLYVAHPNRAKARNAALATARGDIVIFCDDDTVAPPAFVAAHLDAHRSHPRAVVSGPILNVENAAQRPAPTARHWSRAFFCTCNVSVARKCLVEAGGFDEGYELYGWEDTDLGVRLRALGLRRVFSWKAYIYHVKPPETLTLERRRALAAEKGAMAARFVRKSPTWPVRLATGAHPFNFARVSLIGSRPLRRLWESLANRGDRGSLLRALAEEALVDVTYMDALKLGLR